MKKLILLLFLLPCFAKAQNVIYLIGMNANGQPVINTDTVHKVVNSALYNDLLGRPTLTTPTINNGITRPINSTTFTISTTKQAFVIYNITISCTATIGSASSGSVSLQYSTNSGSTWNTVGTVSNSNTVSLAVVLNSVQASGLQICGYIPANALVRMVQTITGTVTISYLTGQEIY